MVKSNENKTDPNEKIPLKQLLNGEKPHFGIFYKIGDFRTPGLDADEVVPPNLNNTNNREGTLWLLTREADGRYYCKALNIKRFNEEEYDIPSHIKSPLL
jgi:hypothetical protein